eukprot:gene669-406_t
MVADDEFELDDLDALQAELEGIGPAESDPKVTPDTFKPTPPPGHANRPAFGSHRKITTTNQIDDCDDLGSLLAAVDNELGTNSNNFDQRKTAPRSFSQISNGFALTEEVKEPCGRSPMLGLRPGNNGPFLCCRCNNQVICFKCDREVLHVADYVWNSNVDYTLFRTEYPCVDKLLTKAKFEQGSACYACHCSWISQDDATCHMDAEDIDPKLRWRCSRL